MRDRIEIVPVGEFRVSTNPGVRLSAVVGSCVALALYDPENKVAGMLHAILPGKRGSIRVEDRNAYYADTGTLILLEEMARSGAQMNRLTAHMTGGGSLAQGESSKSIGQDNLKAVRNTLHDHGIEVVEAGVGGEIGRKIELSVGSGRVEVFNTVRVETGEDREKGDGFKEGLLDEIVRIFGLLKPDRIASARLLDLLHQDPIDWESVWKTVSKDIVLALQTFRLLNSFSYGQPRSIATYNSGLELLGAKHVRRLLVIAANLRHSAVSLIDKGEHSPLLSRHGLATAIISRRLAWRNAPGYGDVAFTAGLFHDLGSLVSLLPISQPLPPCYKERTTEEEADSVSVTLQEMKRLSGAILAKLEIPKSVSNAVSGSEPGIRNSKVPPPLSQIIIQACEISRFLGQAPVNGTRGCHLPMKNEEIDKRNFDYSSISPELITELKDWGC